MESSKYATTKGSTSLTNKVCVDLIKPNDFQNNMSTLIFETDNCVFTLGAGNNGSNGVFTLSGTGTETGTGTRTRTAGANRFSASDVM